MKRHILSLALIAAAVALPGTVGHASARSAFGLDSAQDRVVPIRLSRPVYPAIAVSARISGVVEVTVGVRRDGSVESVVIASGPPLLQQAALEAAQKSQFECRECSEAATPYSLLFSFQLDGATEPPADDEQREAVSVTPSQSRVTIVAETPLAILLFSSIAVRSAKCLYLWRCGSHWGGYDFYYARVRSAKCLWLWKCGFSYLGSAGE